MYIYSHAGAEVSTWARLRVAGSRAAGPFAGLTTMLWRGVAATTGVGAVATGFGAPLAPFRPVAVHHRAVMIEAAPAGLIAGGGKAQGVDTAEGAVGGSSLDGTPGRRNGASEGVGWRQSCFICWRESTGTVW